MEELRQLARDEAAGQAVEPVSIYLNVVSHMARGMAIRSTVTTTLIFRKTRPSLARGSVPSGTKPSKYLKGWWA